MINVTIKQLLEAGVHFGHQTQRWNPKMAQYIFTERNNIHIIDLQKALKGLKKAYSFIREVISQNKSIIFVGTKPQAQGTVKEEAIRCGMLYVNQRWLGGTLTNFQIIRKSVSRLKELERMEEEGDIEGFSKKEAKKLRDEKGRLEGLVGGIKEMQSLPGALFVIDTEKEKIAINEARKVRIPVVAILDTNSDPDEVDYPIPGNDDAIRAIKLIAHAIADAVCEGVQIRKEIAIKEEGKIEQEVGVEEFAKVDTSISEELLSQMVANLPPIEEAEEEELLIDKKMVEESEVIS
ncbi:TPA: 30S ribosomal protein S2 [bacterium]|nr:30S ribosomal protein S2 [bacterium]